MQEPQALSPFPSKWDDSQREVINAPRDKRILVRAGPGTGKTAVACARVSQLIKRDGLEPSRIWLISFTRTAVREIRDRIADHLKDAAAAYAVKIATIDSHAWEIQSGFDEKAEILGDYDENIERMRDLVRDNENVAEYLENVQHLIVDEAQDIVSIRSELVIEIMRKLSSSCGVTVFVDDAQAIYGFADDQEVRTGKARELSFPEKIHTQAAGLFQKYELTKVHRTGCPQLLHIFSETRRKVLAATTEDDQDKLAEVRNEITKFAHGKAPPAKDKALEKLDENSFILYRRRCDVLMARGYLSSNGIPHRVRMSGLPICLMPWIGAALSEHTEPSLDKNRFQELWDNRVRGTALATCDTDSAWKNLVSTAGQTHTLIDMNLLRKRLGRKQPPTEFCYAEFGNQGPIVGTIHAAKGREANTVHLILPHTSTRDIDQSEEARVVFVGATRGRKKLLIGDGCRQYSQRIEGSRRAYRLMTRGSKPYAQVEIGRDIDINTEGLASRHYFPSADAVRASQAQILSFAANKPASLVAKIDFDANFAYRLRKDGEEQCLAVLSKSVNFDLLAVAKAIQKKLGGKARRTPNHIRHLHVYGVRTIVLSPNTQEEDKLHEPWRSSGIMLAPLILGYTKVYFPERR